MSNMRFFVAMIMASMLISGADMVVGQQFPNKPIRIVTSSPGGGNDFSARIIAQGISAPLGQPVIVDYRGVVTRIAETVAKAPPEGYTLLVFGSSLWIVPLVQKVSYDVARDLSPIAQLTREVNVLAVHASSAAKSVKELIALAKDKPGVLNYASTGIAAPTQLAAELFKFMAGVNIVGVAYKSNDPALIGLISGEVQVMFPAAIVAAPHVKAGKLRSLAITSAEPSALVPGLPTIAAAGLPGYEIVGTTGIWAPANTPVAVINRLNREIVRVITTPDIKERYFNSGVEVVASTPEQFGATIKSDIANMGKVIKEAGIRVD